MEPYGIEESERIRYKRMPELVKEQLMDWLMDGTFVMGDRLNAEKLAAKLGVSRMPVREALKSMEKSGIVHSVPYVGARVAELQTSDVIQIYLMRKALEPMAVYYACKNITDNKLQIIEEIHREIKDVISVPNPNAKHIFVLNREFHFEIYNASNMNYLINMISALWDNLALYKLIYSKKYLEDKSSAQKMFNQHQEYINKLINREAEGIKQLMRDSLNKRILELKSLSCI